uniref:3-oxo-5-alpha-steroid 4-dehydrogenase C-terminal domain-containing protein n=1 Tax=Aegilops tauschii TaxID=37682 RepID=R7W6F4_AEGTA
MWPSSLLYPPPASAFVTAVSVVSFASLASAGLSELRGQHMAYSKFWHVVSGQQQKKGGTGGAQLSGRDGMLVAYAPALVAAAASFVVPGTVEGLRAELLAAALAVHFLKRVFEHLTVGLPDPTTDLLYPGVLLFAIGIAGNFYNHYLLSQLRKGGDDDTGYKIPKDGLFEFVTCPHYLFEITGFFGFAMISQTVYALAMAFGTAAYLVSRSFATRRWYESKFEEFPASIKALVPYIL